MEKVNLLNSKSDKEYSLSIPTPYSGYDRSYVFAFAKSGSTLINDMITLYANGVGYPTLSVYNQAFDQGITTNEIGENCKIYIERPGYIYTGFRHYPVFDIAIDDAKSVLLVRDPRDMLVSMYYSIAKSHVIPKKNSALTKQRQMTLSKSIDEDVLVRSKWYLSQFRKYQEKLSTVDLKTYRYEDVIYKKSDWLKELTTYLNLPYDVSVAKNVINRVDRIPDKEQVSEHIRQVHPGDHKKKLQKETIEKLDDFLSEFLTCYGYI